MFTAFATVTAIGGLVGSPAALADPEPPPPPPAPGESAPVIDVPEARMQCGSTWMLFLEAMCLYDVGAFAAAGRHARNPRQAITNFEIVPTPKPVVFTPNAPWC